MSQELGSNLKPPEDLLQTADEAFASEQYELAAENYSSLLNAFASETTGAHPQQLHCMKQLAECSSHLNRHLTAKELWRDICDVYRNMQATPSEKYLLSRMKYTKSCEKLGEQRHAQDSYEELTNEACGLLDQAHPLLISIRQNYSAFLHNTGKKEEAKRIDQLLHRISQEVTNRTIAQNLVDDYYGEHGPLEKQRVSDLRISQAMNEAAVETGQRANKFAKLALWVFAILSVLVFLICFGIWRF
jgi:hypothetical protein